ncbi:hypothetical protein [Streptomyces diastatochromogenes]|uniref:Uncharacterized protein n=1 Tax=Streptomyces diastatochromogenes TaxID=42236 RepID=A0A233S185_STRDA|nr:hypothetical protein [Streptomyces diastatochromogenes]OXY89421.1 hypothetical protein BEK98_38270 [Streptomyces diastatochromogenes]
MPLSDDFPVLLGPVRVETRFTETELLVRVFPDEWCVSTEETVPSDAEFGALSAYWTAMWRAAGRQEAEHAAWQELTGRVPVGRAAWLTDTYRPADPGDRPDRVPPETAVLVIVSEAALPAADRQPTLTYWTSVWRAHGDRARLRAADIALLAAVGAGRADAIRGRQPSGIDAAPVTPYDGVVVAFLVLPRPQTSADSWTRPAKAALLPDRFTVFGYVGDDLVLTADGAPLARQELAVSPDPGERNQLRLDESTGVLNVPDELLWLVDFDEAVRIGMGLRIPLDERTRDGLDRLVVLGLREAPTAEQSAVAFEKLITRQVRSSTGFALLPQGTATNNTGQAPAGQDEKAVAQAGLRSLRQSFAAAPGDWRGRGDGQWFAELLGLDPAVLSGVPNADGTDQRDARAANIALWPATWGAFLEGALHPVLSAEAVAETREFFLRYVSGRGPVPAVKVGRQPYGILPTTAFSRLQPPDSAHRRTLGRILDVAQDAWDKATGKVARVLGDDEDPPPGYDPHQRLLDVLALHPTSAEYHQRYALGVEDYYNRENLAAAGPHALDLLRNELRHPQPIADLLARFGHQVEDPLLNGPELIRRLFAGIQYPLLGPLVDDRPLSETAPVRTYTPGPDGRNYLHWLAEKGRTDLDALRLEDGFADGRPPADLLYLLLRHGLMLGWEDAARRLAVTAGRAAAPPVDPPFVHVRLRRPPGQAEPPSESRWRLLYAPDPAITGNPDDLVHRYIPEVLATRRETALLKEQTDAVELLADLPTARLERVLAEHLDCATYRLDAWRLGQANELLSTLRYGAGTPKRGLHIGAYGLLEQVRLRKRTTLTRVSLTGKLAEVFKADSLAHDSRNGGWIHAPSPAQARTAAVLRAGYLANGSPQNKDAFAVNLSSERVRRALALLDGLRQGQSLGALLGYRFERGLHEGYPGVDLDRFLPALRGAFPLRAGKLSDPPATDSGAPVDIDLVEARNVVDGLELVRRATRPPAAPTYPFGAEHLPEASTTEQAAMNQEVQRLLDLHDALADLAVAEGTHQALLGNPERASATLDAYAKEGFPPDPAVVRTPRSGITLTHRLGLLLTPGLRPDHGTTHFAGGGPRAQAEPALNAWLPALLPAQLDVAVQVTWTDPVDGRFRSRVVTQFDLGLQPIDLLWALRPTGESGLSDLDDRIIGAVVTRDRPRPDAVLTIRYTERVRGKLTLFEVSSLVDTLRSLLTTARPLRPTDLRAAAGPSPAAAADDEAVTVPRERPAAVRTALDALRKDVDTYLADLTPLLPAPPAVPGRGELVSGIDDFLSRYSALVARASGFGMVRSGWGEVVEWRRAVFADLLAAVAVAADRMGRSLTQADALIRAYDGLPLSTPDEQRFALLEQAERLLTTTPTSPRPSSPARLRATVALRRAEFARRLDGLKDVATTTETTLSGLFAEVAALLPLTAFDPIGLDPAPLEDRVVTFARDLLQRAQALRTEIGERLDGADRGLKAYDDAVTGPDRVKAAVDALKAMIGDDVLVVPEFKPSADLADDWRRARDDSARLTAHLTAEHDYPVDDWVHGVARVREKPRLWEKAVHLGDALRGPGGLLSNLDGWQEPQLTPVQLPYRQDDSWLAMEFRAGTRIVEDRLLFTAHYASQPLLGGGSWCGLLLDEWTEVVPAAEETTGIAVHYDGPDSEPPQAMLLVVPPVQRENGTWLPSDLLAAVNETFALARIRAVEPHHLDDTAYAQFLPATLISATRQPITISTDLAVSNLRWKAQAHD